MWPPLCAIGKCHASAYVCACVRVYDYQIAVSINTLAPCNESVCMLTFSLMLVEGGSKFV